MSLKKRIAKLVFVVFIAGFCLYLIFPFSVEVKQEIMLPKELVINDPLAYMIEADGPAENIQKLLENVRDKYTPETLNTPLVLDTKELDIQKETTYLLLAVTKKRSNVVRLLLEAGCDPNLQISGYRPVIGSAIANNDLETVCALMEHGGTIKNAEPEKWFISFDKNKTTEEEMQDRWLMARAKYEAHMFVAPPLLPIVQVLLESEPSEQEREYLQQVLDVLQKEK
jgi:Ankyrin repeat.